MRNVSNDDRPEVDPGVRCAFSGGHRLGWRLLEFGSKSGRSAGNSNQHNREEDIHCVRSSAQKFHSRRVRATGEARRADARGFGEVAGIGEHAGEHIAARAGEQAGDGGGDLRGLRGERDGLVVIAGIIGVEAEVDQGEQLRGGVAICRARASERRASAADSAVRPISRKTEARRAIKIWTQINSNLCQDRRRCSFRCYFYC